MLHSLHFITSGYNLSHLNLINIPSIYFSLQEASFKEFLSRPENRPLVEKHQRREVKQAVQLQEKTAALRFRDKVLESDYDAQVAIAPFLRNKVLRRIVQTFANDPK